MFQVQWYAGLWDFWDLVVDVLDFSHFSNPAFLVFAISNFLLYMWYDVPYVYIADNGMSMGFNESQASMLISIIGIVNMFGEVSSIFVYCFTLVFYIRNITVHNIILNTLKFSLIYLISPLAVIVQILL